MSILSSTLGLVAASTLAFDGVFSTVALFVLSILGVESILYINSSRRLHLVKVEVKSGARTAFVGDDIPLTVEFTNSGSSLGPILAIEKIPYAFKIHAPNDFWIESLPKGKTTTVEHNLKALQMGSWKVGEIELIITDRFGMFKRSRNVQSYSEIQVYPSMRVGEELLRGRVHIGMKPLKRSTVSTSHGSEFSGIREYYPGDDYRQVAWKAMAKSPLRLPKTKEHEYEQSLNVTLVVLNTDTTGEGEIGKRKLDAAAELAIVLAHLAVKTGGEFQVVYSRAGRGERADGSPLHIASRIYNLLPDPNLDLDSVMNTAITASKPKSLILLVLDSPYPRTVDPMILRRAIIKYQFPHALILDTTSFISYSGEDVRVTQASGIIGNRELSHLEEVLSQLASSGISAQICTQSNLVIKALDAFSRSSLVLET